MTERVTVFFEPLDVLHFRDHRPADAGFQALSQSHFPLPSVFRGSLRTALFRQLGADFSARDECFGIPQGWARALLGGRQDPGHLRLRGPLLARFPPAPKPQAAAGRPEAPAVEVFLPRPEDAVPVDSGWRRIEVLRPWTPHDLSPDLVPARLDGNGRGLRPMNGPLPWTSAEPEKQDSVMLFTLGAAYDYLAAPAGGPIEIGEQGAIRLQDLCRIEDRMGLVRDPETLTAAEHMLYLRRSFRFAPGIGFAVDVTLPEAERDAARAALRALHGRTAPLGGRGHRARMHVLPGPLLPAELDAGAPREGATKMWLLAPAILPDAWPGGVSVVISARPIPIGGYDLAARAPRPLRRALPAGAILHVSGLERQAPDTLLPSAEDDRGAGQITALTPPCTPRATHE
ncbi:MAG: hypothetical protein IT372_03595 [Polyangiaceae bacterium]|nr:hypothetical protein [Polyangiaceae bacterium]